MRHYLFLLGFLFCLNSFAVNYRTDSLLRVLAMQPDDSNKVKTLNFLCQTFSDQRDYKKTITYAFQAISLARTVNYKRGLGEGYWNLGYGQSYDTYFNDKIVDYSEGLKNYFIAEKIFAELGNKKFLAKICYSIADNYEYESNFNKAIEYFIKSSGYAEESKMDSIFFESKLRVAGIFISINDPEKALPYFKSTLDLAISNRDTLHIVSSLKGMARLQYINKEYDNALQTNYNALKLSRNLKDSLKRGEIHRAIGSIFYERGKYEEALHHFLSAYAIYSKSKDRRIISDALSCIADVYFQKKKYSEALSYYKRSFDMSTAIGLPESIATAEQSMSATYEQTGDYKLALEYYKRAVIINDSILDFKKTKEITRNEMQYQFDKKEAVKKAAQDIRDAVSSENLKHQKFIRNIFIAGFLLMLIFAFFILQGYQQKKKANKIISKQKREVELQKEITEEKNNEIIASITYAKLIQLAILPASSDIESIFPDSFVLFKPKAIVSGDFYWMQEKNDFIYYAVADCTGHGVPGGFMSMLGSSLLNEIVLERNATEPAEILNMLRDKIINALKQKGAIGENQDGMDIVLFRMDKLHQTLTYSAANNPLWIIQEDKLMEYAYDKQPVGISIGERKSFNQKSIALRKGDCIYAFSDGFADQFGGSEGKKFKSKLFRNLLQSIHQLSMKEQKAIINKTFEDWKGIFEQIDDVCIIGIRI